MADKVLSTEDTITALNARAKSESDSFWIKIFRRRHTGAMPEAVATFSEAQVIHIANPETWLPRIAGGGPIFILSVYHSSDPTVPIGSMIQVSVPIENCPPKQPGEIDPSVIRQPGWSGPRALIWPTVEDKKASPNSMYSIPSSPPAPPTGNSAANNVSAGGQQGAFSQQAEWSRLENERRLDAERERFREMQRELADEKRKIELENLRRENDMRIREMEAKVLAAMNASTASAPKGPDISTTIATLLTAAAPILQQLFAGQNEMRLAIMKQQDAAALQQQNMMNLMMQKPSIDPAIEKAFDRMTNILEKSKNDQGPGTAMIHNMAEAMGMMSGTMMDFFQTASELNLGGGQKDDHPALKAIKQGVKAMNELFTGYQKAVVPPAHPPQAQLNAQQQAYQQHIAAVQAQQQAQAQQVKIPDPAYAVWDNKTPPAAPPPGRSMLDVLEELITSKAPVEGVAQAFIRSLSDPEMQKALDAVEGQINELVARRLGPWITSNPMEHGEYLKRLMDEVNRQGAIAGIFEEEGGSTDDGEDEDE